MKILFILGESGSGKTTLEKHLVDNYGFKTLTKISSRPARDDDSGYIHLPASTIANMYADGIVQECIRYDGHMYAMQVPDNIKEDDCFVACIVPAGYHQFIDIGIEENNDVYSIFLTNDNCEEWMRTRGDADKNIKRRMLLNKKLRHFAGGHEQIDSSRGVEAVTKILSLLYPKLICNEQSGKPS